MGTVVILHQLVHIDLRAFVHAQQSNAPPGGKVKSNSDVSSLIGKDFVDLLRACREESVLRYTEHEPYVVVEPWNLSTKVASESRELAT
jgi:hypothetical protein